MSRLAIIKSAIEEMMKRKEGLMGVRVVNTQWIWDCVEKGGCHEVQASDYTVLMG